MIKAIFFFLVLFGVANLSSNAFAVGTVLLPGDIVIVTANASDNDFFEFVSRVDLTTGTVIYFTDNARSENTARRTTEGTVRYTAPGVIPAGTVMSFIKGYQMTYPALWGMSGGFSFSTAGDTILIYQGENYNDPNPNFIYGIGRATLTSWISSGAPTANNSYIPVTLTLGQTILDYVPGARKNIQYACSNIGMRSSNFLSTISDASYRSGNNSLLYDPISCIFDGTKLQVDIDLADGQNTSTADFTGKFLFTFSETIDETSFTCDDIYFAGTAPGQTCISIDETAPNNGTRFEITAHASGDGSIIINIEGNKVTDFAGNPNDKFTGTNNKVIIDTTPPYLSEVTPISTPSSNTTPSYTFHSNEGGNISYSGFCSSTTPRANPGNNIIVLDILEGGTYTDCTITVTDDLGSISDPLSISSFTIDMTLPTITETLAVPNPTNNITPSYTFGTDEAGLQISYEGDCSSTTTISIAGDNIITFEALSEGEHNNCVISIIDGAGNIGTLNVSSFTIDTIAPSIYEVTPIATPSTNQTPEYIFNSDKVGTITYGGSCSSDMHTAIVGSNTIVLNTLSAGTYDDCTIGITDNAGNSSNELEIAPFTIEIVQEDEQTPSSNGGSSTSLTKDNCPDGDFSPSYYDGICSIKNNEQTTGSLGHAGVDTQKYEGTIKRKTLARFLVFFAKNVLAIYPDESKICNLQDISRESDQDQGIINESCQLGLMGLQKDGLTSAIMFRPNDRTSRDEFITTISRLLYNQKNNIPLYSSIDSFTKHIAALEKENLLINIPNRITQSVIVNVLKEIQRNPRIPQR